jgi:HTH-type transcriptional regulator / antitoxin HigA
MDNDKNLTKALISPPGDTLREHLDFIGMTPDELEERMNLPREKVHGLMCGNEPISADIAARLENELDIPASFWIKRENEYRQELLDCGVGL